MGQKNWACRPAGRQPLSLNMWSTCSMGKTRKGRVFFSICFFAENRSSAAALKLRAEA